MGVDLASTDAPFGLMPYGQLLGANMYAIVTANATAFYVGDMVEQSGTSYLTPHMGNLMGCAVEETGAAGTLLGSVLAVYDHNFKHLLYMPASTTGNSTIAGYALVADHADQLYLAQEDGDTSSIVAANVGLNVDLVSTASGSTNTGLSGMEIDSDTVASTSTLGFRIVGVHEDDTISSAGAAGNHCRFILKMNAAFKGSNSAGA